MKHLFFSLIIITLFISGTTALAQSETVYESGSLAIKKVSELVYIHISYLDTEDYGRVPCNGVIAINDQEAIVMETPVDNEVSRELINWIRNDMGMEIKAVIVHHFHIDCLGGLEEFHNQDIDSFGHKETIKLAAEKGYIPPNNTIEDGREFKLGNQKLISSYFGPAHTSDNIVTYFPLEKSLFGGCMIKSLGSGKGNLADADVNSWSDTVLKIKNQYPDVKVVVPGHGEEGGTDLLNYTIEMFSEK